MKVNRATQKADHSNKVWVNAPDNRLNISSAVSTPVATAEELWMGSLFDAKSMPKKLRRNGSTQIAKIAQTRIAGRVLRFGPRSSSGRILGILLGLGDCPHPTPVVEINLIGRGFTAGDS